MSASQNSTKSKAMRRSFLRDEHGSLAIVFALVLVPLVMSVGIAVDYGRAYSAKASLQAAVDAAALAGASHDATGQANGARQTAAIEILKANATHLAGVNGLQKAVSFSGDTINVTSSLVVPTTLAAIITRELPVSATATAKFGGSAPLCLLALNTVADGAFRAWGTADLIAPKCAVQSHSTSPIGMETGGSATATAAKFCSAGGHSGSAFSPTVDDNCTPSNDPYAGKFGNITLQNQGYTIAAPCDESRTLRIKTNVIYDAGSPTGTMRFCGGLTIQAGGNVLLREGIYMFDGELKVSSGATLSSISGTVYFVNDGFLTVIGGGNVGLRAPTSGALAGIAIVHPIAPGYNGGPTAAITHTIIGGGNVDILGVIYAPQAKVRVTGNGTINSSSKYFSIVSDFVELEGNGQLYISAGADTIVSGMPSMPSAGSGGGYLIN